MSNSNVSATRKAIPAPVIQNVTYEFVLQILDGNDFTRVGVGWVGACRVAGGVTKFLPALTISNGRRYTNTLNAVLPCLLVDFTIII